MLKRLITIALLCGVVYAQSGQHITGEFVLIGKSPDGDSVRFRPDQPQQLYSLKNGGRVDLSKDGTVMLRFEGIDAPELHYQGSKQPFAEESAAALLKAMGFKTVQRRGDSQVTFSQPVVVRGSIQSVAADQYGRPIAWVYTGKRTGIARSLNYYMLLSGMAFPLTYDNWQPDMFKAAKYAQKRRLGVWQRVRTRFTLEQIEQVLIYPKWFRRMVDFRRSGEQTFTNWLANNPDKNDSLRLNGQSTTLEQVLLQDARGGFSCPASPMDMVFVSK